jgi:hypothetical protein
MDTETTQAFLNLVAFTICGIIAIIAIHAIVVSFLDND